MSDYHECPGSGVGEDINGGGDCEWEADFSQPLLSWVSKYGEPMRTYQVGLRITCRRCGLTLSGALDTEKPEVTS